MATQPQLDQAKVEAFMQRVVGDLSGAMVTAMCFLGDRLGLFKELAAGGPATSQELARRAKVNERYAREWLRGMASAGYLAYDPVTGSFTLPAEHAPALAQELGPMFVGGMYQMAPVMMGQLEQIVGSFRDGGGVSQAAYGPSFWEGLERFTGPRFENLLVQEWIPAVPDVQAKLERGASVADVGCGNGRAMIKLAQAFPSSRYVGYDAYAPSVATATAHAQEAGVADKVRFEQRDVVAGLPERYDLITTFDVVHDAVDPRGLLKAIRQGLKADGSYLLLDINCSDKVEENAGPIRTTFHGASLMYCMTTSLAGGGEGLGTLGLPPSKVRELCSEAGFSSAWQLPVENPFNNLYEIRP